MAFTQAGPLRWRAGAGWLALIGGGRFETTESIDYNAIEAMIDEAPIAFVPAASGAADYGEAFLEHYEGLGAPPGYVVPIHDRASANEAGNAQQLARAGLIYIGGGDTQRLLDALHDSAALKAIASAYDNGAVIVGMSAGAMALAAWGVSSDEGVGVLRGWGWLPDAIVAPHYDADRAEALREALLEQPNMIGLGLPEDTALVFSPEGDVATWGRGQVHVTFGSGLLRSMRA
jgi:cyanophycinase